LGHYKQYESECDATQSTIFDNSDISTIPAFSFTERETDSVLQTISSIGSIRLISSESVDVTEVTFDDDEEDDEDDDDEEEDDEEEVQQKPRRAVKGSQQQQQQQSGGQAAQPECKQQ